MNEKRSQFWADLNQDRKNPALNLLYRYHRLRIAITDRFRNRQTRRHR